MSLAVQRLLIEPDCRDLSIAEQCRLLNVPRSSIYYEPRGESAENLALMLEMDKLFTAHPYYGVERIQANLPEPFICVNIKRVRRLLRLMGIMAIYPPLNAQRTSIANSEYEVFPYLLRGVCIKRPNPVWSTDITYVPMKDSFMYLCAVIDWYDRNAPGDNDHYSQPGALFDRLMTDAERRNTVSNIVGAMSGITGPKREEIINRQLCHFSRASVRLGMGVAQGLGVNVEEAMPAQMEIA